MLENLTHFSLSDNSSLSHTRITFQRKKEGGREGGMIGRKEEGNINFSDTLNSFHSDKTEPDRRESGQT